MAANPGLTAEDRQKIQAYIESGNVEDLIETTTRDTDAQNFVNSSKCAEMRRLAREGRSSSEVAQVVDRHDSTVRTHVRGDCGCETDQPALAYDEDREQWVPDTTALNRAGVDDYPACPFCDRNRTGLFTTRPGRGDTEYRCEKCGQGFPAGDRDE